MENRIKDRTPLPGDKQDPRHQRQGQPRQQNLGPTRLFVEKGRRHRVCACLLDDSGVAR